MTRTAQPADAAPGRPPVRLLFLLPLMLSAITAAGAIEAAACGRGSSPASILISDTIAAVEARTNRRGAERCLAYRQGFLAAVHARDVVARCGDDAEARRGIPRLDGAIERLNSGIAESCVPE
jgi:hypothetical protein